MPEDNKSSSSPTLASARNMPLRPAGSTTTTLTLNSQSPEHLALLQYLQKLSREKFFGSVSLEFVKGEINLVKTTASYKPWDLASAESPQTALSTLGGTATGGKR